MRTLAHPHDTTAIRERLRTIRPDSVSRWGRMSAHQMVCHLADSLRMAAGATSVEVYASPITRTLLKWIVFYFPAPWPHGVHTNPEIDQGREGTRPTDFAADLAEVETWLDRVTAPGSRLEPHPHPLFGRLSDAEWLRWGYLHLDHHLRQFGA